MERFNKRNALLAVNDGTLCIILDRKEGGREGKNGRNGRREMGGWVVRHRTQPPNPLATKPPPHVILFRFHVSRFTNIKRRKHAENYT